MTNKLILIGYTIALFASCTQPSHDKNQAANNEQYEEEAEATLHLNNGQQWIANEETHVGMTNIQELISSLDNSVNYDSLISQLKGETRVIINKCDMTGEDHDQLHLVLVPILKSIEGMAAAEDTSAKEVIVTEIEQNLTAYFKHFKTL
jgi:hypothetical protein